MNSLVKGYLLVILSSIIYGFMPLGAKIIYADGVNPISLVFYRNILAVPALLLIVKLKGESLKLSFGDTKQILAFAFIGPFLTPILQYYSYNYISSGMATVLHFIHPIAVILISFLVLREKPRLYQVICVVTCMTGICVSCAPDGSFDLVGCILALLSGVTYAIYIIGVSRFCSDGVSNIKLCLYLSVFCSAMTLSVCVGTQSFTSPSTFRGWAASVAFALCLSVGALGLFQKGARIIGAQRASLLSTFEPVTSVAVGILILREQLTPRSGIGSFLILAAVALIAAGDMYSIKHEKARTDATP